MTNLKELYTRQLIKKRVLQLELVRLNLILVQAVGKKHTMATLKPLYQALRHIHSQLRRIATRLPV